MLCVKLLFNDCFEGGAWLQESAIFLMLFVSVFPGVRLTVLISQNSKGLNKAFVPRFLQKIGPLIELVGLKQFEVFLFCL